MHLLQVAQNTKCSQLEIPNSDVVAHLKELEGHSLPHGLFGGETTAHVGTGEEAPQTLPEENTEDKTRRRCLQQDGFAGQCDRQHAPHTFNMGPSCQVV